MAASTILIVLLRTVIEIIAVYWLSEQIYHCCMPWRFGILLSRPLDGLRGLLHHTVLVGASVLAEEVHDTAEELWG